MHLLDFREPLLRPKQEALDVQDLRGLLRIQLRFRGWQLLSLAYTRIDQVFVLWGWIALVIFGTAQFLPMSWKAQAIAWSGLTAVGIIGMTLLAWFWVRVERLRWVIYTWAGLMALGVGLTNWGIWGGQASILINLCPLWLGLSALGYLMTGIGMESKTFVLAALLHGLGIALLPHSQGMPFLFTGLTIGGTLLLLAEIQWDMRPPVETAVLSETEKEFNRQQHLRRLTEA